ncbi:hypothetical protein HY989_05695 [Candidatus Micrarchaeota archaeon]|nr:hypothetical protein [Candidatus Micrarchaeota archaeon]
MEFGISIARFGDPLIDPTSTKANCCFLLDRKNRKIFLAISDAKFSSLNDETKMLWLREFGVVSNALEQSFSFPPEVEFLEAKILPPDQYSFPKILEVSIELKTSRETIAWFSRAFWTFFEERGADDEIAANAEISWISSEGMKTKSKIRQFLKRPRIISQKDMPIQSKPQSEAL